MDFKTHWIPVHSRYPLSDYNTLYEILVRESSLGHRDRELVVYEKDMPLLEKHEV